MLAWIWLLFSIKAPPLPPNPPLFSSLCRSGRLQSSWRCLIMGRSRTSPQLHPWGTPAPWLAPATRTPPHSTTAPSPSHPIRRTRRRRTARSGSSWRGEATRVSPGTLSVGLCSCCPWAKHSSVTLWTSGSSHYILCQKANELISHIFSCYNGISVLISEQTRWRTHCLLPHTLTGALWVTGGPVSWTPEGLASSIYGVHFVVFLSKTFFLLSLCFFHPHRPLAPFLLPNCLSHASFRSILTNSLIFWDLFQEF